MRFVSTFAHGLIDYATGFLLVIAGVMFRITGSETAGWVALIAGLLVLGQAVMTRSETGLFKLIPMPMHLGLDVVLGMALAISPWVFGFNTDGMAWLPHLIVGIGVLGLAMVTETHAGASWTDYRNNASENATGADRDRDRDRDDRRAA